MRTDQDIITKLNASDESPRIETKRSREIGNIIDGYGSGPHHFSSQADL